MTPKVKKALAALEASEQHLADVGCKEIERQARTILRRHPHLTGFCMGMGTWSFSYDKYNDTQYLGDYDQRAYLTRITKLIDELTERVKITGIPMRIDGPDAPRITNW